MYSDLSEFAQILSSRKAEKGDGGVAKGEEQGISPGQMECINIMRRKWLASLLREWDAQLLLFSPAKPKRSTRGDCQSQLDRYCTPKYYSLCARIRERIAPLIVVKSTDQELGKWRIRGL
jgi:hypothetical protein